MSLASEWKARWDRSNDISFIEWRAPIPPDRSNACVNWEGNFLFTLDTGGKHVGIRLTPKEALDLAMWILDTFGELPRCE